MIKQLKMQTWILGFYKTWLSDDDNQMKYKLSLISSELKQVSIIKKAFGKSWRTRKSYLN